MFEQYISELLYKYDSVILPGFGAFVLKYVPASIHPVENKFLPPSKIVSFDPAQNYNDGILANFISEKKRISFIDASSEILTFVNDINKSLSEGKQVVLKEIGCFSKSSDNEISFAPDALINYNLEAYGMEEIVSAPILRDDIKERLQKQFSENTRTVKERKVFPKTAIWIIIIIVILGGSVGSLLIIKPDFIHNIKLGSLLKPAEKNEKPVLKEQNKLQKGSNIKKDKPAIDSIKVNTSANIKNSSVQTDNKLYYIISASFRIKENADNYALTLKKKGYVSDIIFLQVKGMYVVSYNSYKSQADAEQALSKIMSAENPGAWILNY